MKSFNEIYSTNVNKHVEVKEQSGTKLSYLSWAYAWAEIKKIDESANYIIHENAEGNPFFVSVFGIDVKVSVTVNNITHTMRLPVMDGANKAMKVESYKYTTKSGEKTVKAADAFDINKTIMRCLVKAIAMHGLGLYIYAGEDIPESESVTNNTEKQSHVASGLFANELTHDEVFYTAACEDVKGACYNNKEQLKKLGFKFETNLKTWIKVGDEITVKIPGITFEKMTKEVFLNSIKEAKNEIQ